MTITRDAHIRILDKAGLGTHGRLGPRDVARHLEDQARANAISLAIADESKLPDAEALEEFVLTAAAKTYADSLRKLAGDFERAVPGYEAKAATANKQWERARAAAAKAKRELDNLYRLHGQQLAMEQRGAPPSLNKLAIEQRLEKKADEMRQLQGKVAQLYDTFCTNGVAAKDLAFWAETLRQFADEGMHVNPARKSWAAVNRERHGNVIVAG